MSELNKAYLTPEEDEQAAAFQACGMEDVTLEELMPMLDIMGRKVDRMRAEITRLRAENAAMREHGLPCAWAVVDAHKVYSAGHLPLCVTLALPHAEALLAGLEDENV